MVALRCAGGAQKEFDRASCHRVLRNGVVSLGCLLWRPFVEEGVRGDRQADMLDAWFGGHKCPC
jgi:hypothetical protein